MNFTRLSSVISCIIMIGGLNVFAAQSPNVQKAADLKKMLPVYEKQYGANSLKVAETWLALGNTLNDIGTYREGKLYSMKAAAYYRLHPDPAQLATSLDYLSRAAFNLSEYKLAESSAKEALPLAEKAYGQDSINVAYVCADLADVYTANENYKSAQLYAERHRQLMQKGRGPGAGLASAIANLGRIKERLKQTDEAEKSYKEAIAMFEKNAPERLIDIAITKQDLAAMYNRQHKYDAAQPLLLRALSMKEKEYGKDSGIVGGALTELAATYKGQGKYDQAEAVLKRLLVLDEKTYGAAHKYVQMDRDDLAEIVRLKAGK